MRMTTTRCEPIAVALLMTLGAALAGCGEDDPPPPFEQRCGDGVAMFAGGDLDTGGAIELSTSQGAGQLRGGNMYLRFADGPQVNGRARPLVVRFYTSDGNTALIDRVSAALRDEDQVTLEVLDASGAEDTAVTELSCRFEDGQVCALVGVESDDDGLITEDDLAAYHGVGGQLVFEELGGLAGVIRARWTLELGADVLAEEPSSQTQQLDGCLQANYSQADGNIWEIE